MVSRKTLCKVIEWVVVYCKSTTAGVSWQLGAYNDPKC